jgi:hypothetical protein
MRCILRYPGIALKWYDNIQYIHFTYTVNLYVFLSHSFITAQQTLLKQFFQFGRNSVSDLTGRRFASNISCPDTSFDGVFNSSFNETRFGGARKRVLEQHGH